MIKKEEIYTQVFQWEWSLKTSSTVRRDVVSSRKIKTFVTETTCSSLPSVNTTLRRIEIFSLSLHETDISPFLWIPTKENCSENWLFPVFALSLSLPSDVRLGRCCVFLALHSCLFCMFNHHSLKVQTITAEPDASRHVISVHIGTLFMTRPAILTFTDTCLSTESCDIVNRSTSASVSWVWWHIGRVTKIHKQKTRQRTFNGTAPKQKVEKWARYLGTRLKHIKIIFGSYFL
jgi:hypothetical protein